jgi:hypothetical protein
MTRYLPHVERSIERLGFVKPDYAKPLALLLEQYEGTHPHQVARKFRQTGRPLSPEAKREHGIRCQVTTEALDALTQRGLADPMRALEHTLLDASFSYFRSRAVADGNSAGYDSFKINGMFSEECGGCKRLDSQTVNGSALDALPPPDCAREACAIGLTLHIDFLADLDRAAEPSKGERKGLLSRLFGW